MAFSEALRPQPFQHVGGQAQHPQLIGDGALAFSQTPRGLLLAQSEQGDELADALGLLDEIQVSPLDVFDQGDNPALFQIHVHNDAGYLREPRQPRGPQPPLPGDQLKAVSFHPHGQRLQDPVLRDGGPELVEALSRKILPGLHRPGHDFIHRHIGHTPHEAPVRCIRHIALSPP